MKKKLLSLALACGMVFSLAACGTPANNESPAPNTESPAIGTETPAADTPTYEPATVRVAYMPNLGSDVVVGNKAKGIETIEDLKGKTVAVSSGTSSEIILEQALARAGMTMDDINTVEMTVDGMTTAMISGQIDAAASWSPNTVTLQNALGDNYVDLGTNADFLDSAIFPSSYICTPEYAEANHDILVRFAQALDKAHDWRAAHPEEMAKLLAKELDAPEDTMLAAVGEADWQTITEVCGDMDAIKTVYETQQGIFLDNGTITENVPVEDYVLFDVMQEANDAYSAAK